MQLVTGDVANALETLRRVQAGEHAESTVDPSMLRWHEELAETLVANDAPEGAAALLAEVRPVAERLERARAARMRPGVRGVSGGERQSEEAAELLTRTADRFSVAGLPLEQGRALTRSHGLSAAAADGRPRRTRSRRRPLSSSGQVRSPGWPW